MVQQLIKIVQGSFAGMVAVNKGIVNLVGLFQQTAKHASWGKPVPLEAQLRRCGCHQVVGTEQQARGAGVIDAEQQEMEKELQKAQQS